jgi:hypothetical protein
MQKTNTPTQAARIAAGNLDKTESMQDFLKSAKILNELKKGVQSMKHYLYPSVLQKQAIGAIKKADTKNVVIAYQEMSGIKITVFLPLLNDQIKCAVMNSGDTEQQHKPLYTLVLCHSFVRCAEVAETLEELTSFCSELLDIVNLDSGDLAEVALKLKLSMQETNPMRSRVIIATPSLALKL